MLFNNSKTSLIYGCSSLKEAYFTDSQPQRFGKNVFDNCAPDFTITAINSNGKWTQSNAYNAKAGTWNGYPAQFRSKTVKAEGTSGSTTWSLDSNGTLEIGSTGAMSGSVRDQAAEVKSIVVSEGTTNISEGMFDGFENLESVELPDTVSEIGENAFKDCERLSSVELSANVEDIAPNAFDGCKALTEIVVSEDNPNYSSEDGKLFDKDKTELICVPAGAGDESYTVPETVEKIGDGAFSDCEAITEVAMAENVKEIGDGAFSGCENLTSIKVTKPRPKMMLMAARVIANDEWLTLPSSIEKIGSEAFEDCSSIVAIKVGANVTEIGFGAFANCSNLVSIEVDANNPSYCSVDGILYSKDRTVLICVPAGLTGEYEIASSVTDVADGASAGCTSGLTLIVPTALKGKTFGACTVKFAGETKTHTYELRVIAPNCMSEGYTVLITDGVEGEHTNITEKTAHKYGAWQTVTAAGCSFDGTEERVCSVCRDKQSRTIKGGHVCAYTLSAATCTTDECEIYRCINCDYVSSVKISDRLGHDYIHHDGKSAGCTSNGWEAYDTCSRCDYSTYKEIKATGHHYVDGVCEDCGEKQPEQGGIMGIVNRIIEIFRSFFARILSIFGVKTASVQASYMPSAYFAILGK